MTSIKSVAGHVLSTGEATPDESKRLAAAVLGDDSLTPRPSRSLDDLKDLLRKVDGVEGQKERADEIRKQIAALEADQ